jgi:hypothetical protein
MPNASDTAARDYLFDLLGYRVIQRALSAEQVGRINRWVDAHPPTKAPAAGESGEWIGDVELHTYQNHDGVNYQNIIEGGEVFEEAIDHPSWIDDIRRYICNDYHRASLNEAFLNVRESGGFIGIHSGGHVNGFPCVTRHHTGKWMLGQINILMALTDIGPGDGATTVIPGSHKSHEIHPALRAVGDRADKPQSYNDDVIAGEQLGMIEVHLRAGDALMFTDGITHGSSARTNAGQRRVMIYRYSPHILQTRYNYLPSEGLLARLTPSRRAIVASTPLRMRPGRMP